MLIAVIGAGFSGLALSWYLLDFAQVVLFDQKGVGGGASGIATGLMHPYPAQDARLSHRAFEGIEETKTLLKISENEMGEKVFQRGIVRIPFEGNALKGTEVLTWPYVFEQKGFFIDEGMTVFTDRYLQGLWKACEKKGAVFRREKILNLNDLSSFDATIFAGGAGICAFSDFNALSYEILKGQVLTCRIKDIPSPPFSIVGKGYIALSQHERIFHLGSTYERNFTDETPDLEKAKKMIFSQHPLFTTLKGHIEILECKSALRVTNKAHYFPFAKKIKSGLYLLSAMGSRGLLYHALLAKELSMQLKEEL